METRSSSISMCEQDGPGRQIGRSPWAELTLAGDVRHRRDQGDPTVKSDRVPARIAWVRERATCPLIREVLEIID